MQKKGMPFRVPSLALLAMWRARAYKLTPEEAVRMAAIKGAYEAHKVIRASGRVPGEEARAAALVAKKARREQREREARLGPHARKGTTNLDGI
jgi:hypothetical protein